MHLFTRVFTPTAIAVLLGVFLVGVTPPLPAQSEGERPRVLVIPLVNATGRSENDALAQTTTDTIRLTINLLGRYEVLAWDGSPEDVERVGEQTAAEAAERMRADSVLFGRVSRNDAGTFQFSVSVFDRAENRITETTETESPTLFGVFDAADELVANAVSAFSGERVGFGSVRLLPEEDISYRVFVDGSAVGENVSSLERILIGSREIEIAELVDGNERLIYSETVNVSEGETLRISFSAPEATPDEIARASELVTRLRRNLDAGIHHARVREDLDSLRSLAEIAPSALPDGPATLRLLEQRARIVGDLDRLAATDFRALAMGSEESTIGDMQEALDRVEQLYQPWVAASQAGDPILLADARRNAEVALTLMRLEREAVRNEADVEMVARLNRMIARSHNYFSREDVFSSTQPHRVSTRRTQEFLGDYTRMEERRTPFWHWIAGTIGVAGLGVAGYVQFGGLYDEAVSERDEAHDAYVASTSSDVANDARDELETAQQEVDLLFAGSIAGAGVGVLLPVAILSRINSVRRPGRVWRNYNEEPFRVQWRAAALDYRSRPWEDEGSGAVLLTGDGEAVSAPGLEPGATTPALVQAPAGETITVTYETAAAGDRSEYTVDITENLTVLHLRRDR